MYFKDDYRLDVMTSTALVNKAPSRFDWARYYSTFQKQSMSPRALAISVYHGYGFTPVWTTARREENFVSAGHMAFDFDAGDESSSLEYIRREGTFAWMFASFGYTTASHTRRRTTLPGCVRAGVSHHNPGGISARLSGGGLVYQQRRVKYRPGV